METTNLGNNVIGIFGGGIPLFFLQCLPVAAQQLGWDGFGPSALLELLAADHEPGLYHISAPIVMRTPAGVGTVDRVVSFAAPGRPGITQILQTPIAVTDTGLGFVVAGETVGFVSDGSAPITVQYMPNGVSGGPPVLDIYAAALLNGRLLPAP
jgi:hypothetical protein